MSSTAFYDAVAPHYDAVYGVPEVDRLPRMRAMLEGVELPRHGRALIFGVGTGLEVKALETILGGGLAECSMWELFGVDNSPAMLREVHRKGLDCVTVLADLADCPKLPDGANLIVASHGLLEHMTDEAALEQVFIQTSDCLEKGGVAVFEGPTEGYATNYEGPDVIGWPRNDGYYALFDKRSSAQFDQRIWSDRQLLHASHSALGLSVDIRTANGLRIVTARRA